MAQHTLTLDRLRQVLNYAPETGLFTWKIKLGSKAAGQIAGNTRIDGYVVIVIDGVCYTAHRLAVFIVTGELPQEWVDHKNGDPSDNRWENLRPATPTLNGENRRRPNRNNKSGFLGVSPDRGRWKATIRTGRKVTHLGMYDTPEDAYKVYLDFKRAFHDGCTI